MSSASLIDSTPDASVPTPNPGDFIRVTLSRPVWGLTEVYGYFATKVKDPTVPKGVVNAAGELVMGWSGLVGSWEPADPSNAPAEPGVISLGRAIARAPGALEAWARIRQG